MGSLTLHNHLKNDLLTVHTAWAQEKLPILKLTENSCFLIRPTEWEWRKLDRYLGDEVALLFL